jgi:glycosyltransferase involved in cell wall biosynthesis
VHLALVTHKFARGDGQGRVNYEIAAAALAAGHTVSLVATEAAAELAGHARARHVRIDVDAWPSALLKNQIFALKTTRWLKRHEREIDIVHVNGFVTWARTDLNTAHFVHTAWLRSRYHTIRFRKNWYGLYQWLYTYAGSFLERAAYRRSRMIAAVSQQVHRELSDAGVDSRRLQVIANGVDLEEFKPAPVSRATLGLPDGVLMLFAGDIKTPRKNLETLLRALARCPGGTLLVAGEASGSPYPRLAAALGIAGRVKFLGFRRDVPDLMRAVDLFVFPSRYEACSLVLLEAAASGVPVVAARTAGGVELLNPDCCVLVDDPDDDVELAKVLDKLVANTAALTRMGSAARATAELHSWKAMSARYLQAYATLEPGRRNLRAATACAASTLGN